MISAKFWFFGKCSLAEDPKVVYHNAGAEEPTIFKSRKENA